MLCFRKLPVPKKIMQKRGGIKIFRRKCFCLRVPKNFVGENFCAVLQKISGSEKIMDKRGVSRFSVERFFVSECRNFRRGKFLCCVAENFR